MAENTNQNKSTKKVNQNVFKLRRIKKSVQLIKGKR